MEKTWRDRWKRPGETGKKDLERQVKKTWKDRWKRPGETGEKDLERQVKKTWRDKWKRRGKTGGKDLERQMYSGLKVQLEEDSIAQQRWELDGDKWFVRVIRNMLSKVNVIEHKMWSDYNSLNTDVICSLTLNTDVIRSLTLNTDVTCSFLAEFHVQSTTNISHTTASYNYIHLHLFTCFYFPLNSFPIYYHIIYYHRCNEFQSVASQTIWAWVFIIDRLDTSTEVQLYVLLNEAGVKRTQVSVLVVDTVYIATDNTLSNSITSSSIWDTN